MRYFNTSGPMIAKDHYHVPPLSQFDLAEVRQLIDWRNYFVIYAPRRTGKTSVLLALEELLNAEGDYRCVYFNVEAAQAVGEDVTAATEVILDEMARQARRTGDEYLTGAWSQIFADYGPGALGAALSLWAAADKKPLVLLIDETDSLVGDSLLALLRQLRASYHMRPDGFPQSVVLCGVRDVRDYRIHSGSAKARVTGGSGFNISAESLRLGDFGQDDVRELLGQHTDETGQPFTDGALEAVWTQTPVLARTRHQGGNMRMFPVGDADAVGDDYEPSPEYQEHIENEEYLHAVATDGRRDVFATNETIARAALYLGYLLNEIAGYTFPGKDGEE